MSGKKAHTYTLAPETNKMLFYLSQREGISKSSWLSRQIRREWDRISGSYLDEAIRTAQLQAAEALSSTHSTLEPSVVGSDTK